MSAEAAGMRAEALTGTVASVRTDQSELAGRLSFNQITADPYSTADVVGA